MEQKEDVLEQYSGHLFKSKTMKVIQRYDGVAFDYLEHSKIKKNENLILIKCNNIFKSFGPLKLEISGLPDYKLKQGLKLFDLK